MRVEHAHQRSALPGEILNAQKGNAGEGARTQRRFDLLAVAQVRQLARGFHLLLPCIQQAFVDDLFADQLVVDCAGHAAEVVDLVEVRQHLKLSHLEGEHRLLRFLAHVSHSGFVIVPGVWVIVVEITLHLGVGGAELMLAQVGGGVEIALALMTVPAVMGVGRAGVQARRVQCVGDVQQGLHALVAQVAAGQLVAEGQHHEGRVIRQRPEGAAQFGLIIGPAFLVLKGGLGIPVAQLRLHEHAHFVRGGEGGLRRRVAVEAHVVDPVAAVGGQHFAPCLNGHGRMTGFGENGAVGFAAQEDAPSVEGQETTLGPEVAHAEAYREGRVAQRGGQVVEVALLLVPAADVRLQRQILQPGFIRARMERHRQGGGSVQRVAADGDGDHAGLAGIDLHAYVQKIAVGIRAHG